MGDWPVGLSTGCFYRKSIFDVLQSIRDSGISVLEICSYPAHLDYHDSEAVIAASGYIKKLGLEPFSFHAPFADDIDITSPDRDQHNHSVNEIIMAARAAAQLKVSHFVIHPGPEKEGRPPAEEHLQRLKRAVEALNKVSEFCRLNNLNLTLENMLPHLLFGHTSDLLWLLGAVDIRNLGICLDTGHANLAGDLYMAVFKLSGHLKMIHAADNRGQHDDHLPPGRGNINWRRLIQDLIRASFHGTLIMELSGDLGKTDTEILQEAVHARQYIREIQKETVLCGGE